MTKNNRSYQTIHRIPKILNLLSRHPEGLPLKTIVEGLDHPPRSSIFVILQELVTTRYLTFDSLTKTYKIGPALIKLSSVIMHDHTIQRYARDGLKKVTNITGENSYLGILDGYRLRYIDKVEGNNQIRLNIIIGSSAHLHASAIGKLLLAHQDEEEIKEYMETSSLRKVTHTTITDPDELLQELVTIRELGCSISREESLEGLYAYAAPIVSANKVVAGITVVPHKSRALREEQYFIDIIKKIAHEISEQLEISVHS